MDHTYNEIKEIARKYQLNVEYGGIKKGELIISTAARRTGKSWFMQDESLTYFMTKFRKKQHYSLIGTDAAGGIEVAAGQDVHNWLINNQLRDDGRKAGWDYTIVESESEPRFWGTVARVTLTPELYSLMILQWAN
jgi:hypothetical protein